MLTITLPGDIADLLIKQAQKQGTTPELLAIDTLRITLTPPDSEAVMEGETLYDFLAPYLGTIEGTGEALSENTGERFTEYVIEKYKQGRL